MQVEVEPFEPSAKSAHVIYPLVRRSSTLLATSSQTSAKSRSSFLTTASSAFSASCRYVAACLRLYRGLPLDRRRQFLKAAAKFQEATMHWAERPTLCFALMVVACE